MPRGLAVSTHPAAPSSGDETGGGGGGGAQEVLVSSFEGSTSTFLFEPLPNGLFNSDGDIARHVFQLKADSVWTDVDINGDGTLDLEECSSLCFP